MTQTDFERIGLVLADGRPALLDKFMFDKFMSNVWKKYDSVKQTLLKVSRVGK